MAAYTTLPSTHIVEGREPLSMEPFEGDKLSYRDDSWKTVQNRRFQKKLTAQKEEYRLIDEARKKIKPIADPDAEKSERRKKRARQGLTGRLGTILTERLG